MNSRLQVLIAEDEMAEIRGVAQANHLTVAEWVRLALRRACEAEPRRSMERKLESLDAAARHSFPVGDIDSVLDEIQRGHLETR